MKTAIVYYSKKGENWFDGKKQFLEKGNCEVISEYLQKLTQGDRFEIQMVHPYSESYDDCCKQAHQDLEANNHPEIQPLSQSLDDYERIYLVYPIYWSTCPMAVLSFLDKYDCNKKEVFLISTHEGSGLGYSVYSIEKEGKFKAKNCLPIPGTLASRSYNRLKRFVLDEND